MIRLITDTCSLYSKEEGEKKGIIVNPLSITLNNISYKEYEEISSEEAFNKINNGELPSTSQPNLGNLLEIYEKYKDDELIHICVADGLSGTYSVAMSCREMVENKDKIHIINCQTLCGPEKYLVDLAKKLIDEGKKVEEILSTLKEKIKSSKSVLIPMDFDFLRRGGRLSPGAAIMASTLKLSPLMVLADDGKSINRHSINRTLTKTFREVVSYLEKHIKDENCQISISHAYAEESNLEKLKGMIKERFPKNEVLTYILSPVFIAHGGPKCIAIQTIDK